MNKPNFIKCLLGAFEIFDADKNINKKEISLYMALFRLWNRSFFKDEISAKRRELRKASKIGSNEYLLIALSNLQSSGVLTVYEKGYQFEEVRLKMTRSFENSDVPTDPNLTCDDDTSVTPHTESETPIVPLVIPFNYKENSIENSLKKEKKENDFEDVKKDFEKYYES
jgi:hypothetical protein